MTEFDAKSLDQVGGLSMQVFTAVFFSAIAFSSAPSGELLDFSATWCGPCQQMAPLVDRLARQGYPVRKVDIDQQKDLARQYGIQSIPAFVLVVNGKVVKRATGIQSEAQLMQMLALIPKPAPKSVPEFAPEFHDTKATRPLLVDSRGSLSREMVSLISSQPTVTAVSAPRQVEPPQAKSQPAPSRGLLGLNLLGRSTKNHAPAKKSLPPIVRANLDDQPLADIGVVQTNNPLAASTRLRISDKEGINLGSGTIVECKIGQALILTCGHIFRNIQPDSVIEVDLFLNGKVETIVGKAVKYDLETDLGLISIPIDSMLSYTSIAATAEKPAKGTAVESVGCGHGNDPTLQKHVVTHVNRYNGPENIECTGIPVQGRSGGGLFNRNGALVGICMAADTKEHRGLYVGLGAVQKFLLECQLQRLLPDFVSEDETPEFDAEEDHLLVNADANSEAMLPEHRGLAALQAAIKHPDTEIVCLVRAGRSSQSGQRVVILSGKHLQASPTLSKR